MLKFKETLRPLAVVSDESSEVLWDMIKSVQNSADKENTSCDSLLKLAHKLGEESEWIKR